MNGSELRLVLDAALAALIEQADEFRRLDAAIGDGDLGVTVSEGAKGVRAAFEAMPADTSMAETVAQAGRAFTKANPSTFSALIGMSLTRASASLGEDPVGGVELAAFAREFLETVGAKGKSAPGDKTVLDALAPAVDSLDASLADGVGTDAALAAMIEAAQRGIEETAPLESKRGRARWLGERSRGHQDPGAVVVLRFLEAIRDASGPARGA